MGSQLVSSIRRLVADCRGAVTTEYVILLATVGVVVALGVFGLGPGLVRDFSFTRSVITSPTP